MSITDIVRSLHTLGRDYVVAPRPDHPMLLTGPSVIVGGRGALFAIFRPTVLELRNPSLLLLRLALSRLALPETTRTILAVGPDRDDPDRDDQGFFRVARHHFDHPATDDDTRSFLSFILGANRPGHHLSAVRDIREQAYQRAYLVVQASRRETAERPARRAAREELFDQLLGRDYTPVLRREWARFGSEQRRHSLSLFRRGDVVVADVRLLARRSTTEALKPYALAGTGLSYTVDAGIPYPVSLRSIKIMTVDTLPVARFDPEKPIRALALAGWVMTFAASADQLESLQDKLRHSLPEDLR